MLGPVLALAVAAAVALLTSVAYQLHRDRPAPPARHRPAPKVMLALPAAPVREPAPFDPLSPETTLDEVERFLDRLNLEADWADANRENWARQRVADAGHSWDTHLAKFSGAVLPREDDTRELDPVR